MGKYANSESDVFAVFSATEWKETGIKTYPSNFVAMDQKNEFIRVNVITSGQGLNLSSASGLLIIDIFIPAGKGPKRASLIADNLDKFLAGKSKLSGTSRTQFFGSSLSPIGPDPDNQGLHRSSYSIPFSHFGVNT